MWNSFQTDGAVGVHAEITTFPDGSGDEIHAYVAKPPGEGRLPGVVVIHHLPGWDEFYQEFAQRLAKHGYQVISPDLYCRLGHGTPDDMAAAVRAQGGVADDQVVADVGAARQWLLAQPNSNGKVGVIGSCSGGRHAVLAASRLQGFDALVDLWGGGVVMKQEDLSDKKPVAPIDYTADLDAPILGIFGNEDKGPAPEQVDLHEAELKRLGKDYEFHRYDGAGHGFLYHHNARYRQEQAMDAWEKIWAFFGDKLGG